MHLKCPSGHTRWKQGLHSMSMRATRASGDNGGVYSGLDEPNSATSGVPTAAAACIRPESLLTTTLACASRSIAVPRSVRPQALRTSGTAAAIGIARRAIVGRSDQPHRVPRSDESSRQRDEMLARPALGGPEFRARAKSGDGPARGKPERAHRFAGVGGIGDQHRRRRARRELARHRGEADEAVDQARQRPPVEATRVGEQHAPRLADVADAPRNARKPRDQRGLERVRAARRRACIRACASSRPRLRRARRLSSRCSNGLSMTVAYAAHARIDGRAPRRRQHVDDGGLERLAKQRDQRLRQDRVADPRGRDDQDALSHASRSPERRGDVKGARRSRRQCPPRATSPVRR